MAAASGEGTALSWARTAQPPAVNQRAESIDYAAQQGLVARGYGEKPHATFLMYAVSPGCAEASRAFVAALPITDGVDAPRPFRSGEGDRRARRRHAPVAINVAMTYRGLLALGMDGAVASATFSEPFQFGMGSGRTAAILRDEPSTFAWCDTASAGAPEVHLAVLIYADTRARLEETLYGLRADATLAGLFEVASLDDSALELHEPFGFADGIAQPRFDPDFPEADAAPGEFILGYPNAWGRLAGDWRAEGARPEGDADIAHVVPFLRGGSYLVIRDLRQDVRSFWRYFASQASSPNEAVFLAAKAVGRWPSGAPFDQRDREDAEVDRATWDDFGFAARDAEGLRCPFGAHIRRMHPRDWLFGGDEATVRALNGRHRILRRGRPYGLRPGRMTALQMAAAPDRIPVHPQGLYFGCLNTDIHRQFEFLQQTWANNAKFAGLCDSPDPLIGVHERRDFIVQRDPVRRRLRNLPNFVRVRAGGYFFLPSMSAIRSLFGAPSQKMVSV